MNAPPPWGFRQVFCVGVAGVLLLAGVIALASNNGGTAAGAAALAFVLVLLARFP